MDQASGFPRDYFVFEFPLSEQAWHRYAVRSVLPNEVEAIAGSAPHSLRSLAARMNEEPSRQAGVEPAMPAESLLALRTVNQVLRWVSGRYFLEENPGSLDRSRRWIGDRLGSESVGLLYQVFVELFPPLAVQMARTSPRAFLNEPQQSIDGHDLATIEMILLFLNRANPAAREVGELFEDKELRRRASFVPFVTGLEDFLDRNEPAMTGATSVFSLLRAPMQASPHSLAGQIEFMQENWGHLLPADLLERLQLALDVLQETDVARGGGAGPAPVLEFGPGSNAWGADGPEPEAFSADADWMSNVVLMAKSVYVWLDQLSRSYGRPIHGLNDIPDEELDKLASWGVNGLWLIGLWERSEASRKIKQYMGNPEAAASAYALRRYRIADDLGGDDAWSHLSERASARGIRLASDMVPNHMGLDSDWVMDHPEYFLQTEHPPYPAYSFTGGDLSDHPDVGIHIEDGYWNHSDAAVVFQRVDRRNGHTCYIYHGNDGTSMPWNDTAQLNFLVPQVREAVINVILDVARKFPIIRFDAAMTLARKHYQRLWFPAPGDAGAIPSRAEHGLSKPEFEQVFPAEFWREVVDRVAAEVPDTLLLAEAFWLMEGFFVRTLGMHRVYNSAFMNMLKMEENGKYRQTIRNVLEYSPEILKRFVNFMNNPDEKTAVEQFGRGDKYFGCTVLLATMPGLPMLGHGQIEGFTEKYGMEYRKAYWDEQVDPEMVGRHERDIFPLLRRRHLFSGSENFRLFDFHSNAGHVDENVFAYSNGAGTDRVLVLYNNAYESTSGGIHHSIAANVGPAEEPRLSSQSLAPALAVEPSSENWLRYRDVIRGQEFLMPAHELHKRGFALELHGYEYRVLSDFRPVDDAHGIWSRLAERLAGSGCSDLEREYRKLELEPVLERLREELDTAPLADLEKRWASWKKPKLEVPLGLGSEKEFQSLWQQVPKRGILSALLLRDLLLELPDLLKVAIKDAQTSIELRADDETLVVAELARELAELPGSELDAESLTHLARYLAKADKAMEALDAGRTDWIAEIREPFQGDLLGVNQHDGISWIRLESLENLLLAMTAACLLDRKEPNLRSLMDARALILEAAEAAGYRAKPLFEALQS